MQVPILFHARSNPEYFYPITAHHFEVLIAPACHTGVWALRRTPSTNTSNTSSWWYISLQVYKRESRCCRVRLGSASIRSKRDLFSVSCQRAGSLCRQFIQNPHTALVHHTSAVWTYTRHTFHTGCIKHTFTHIYTKPPAYYYYIARIDQDRKNKGRHQKRIGVCIGLGWSWVSSPGFTLSSMSDNSVKREKPEPPLISGNDSKRIKPARAAANAAGGGGASVSSVAPAASAAQGAKRATRASTGAPIALTAKGSLYRAHKDTGEPHLLLIGGVEKSHGCFFRPERMIMFIHEYTQNGPETQVFSQLVQIVNFHMKAANQNMYYCNDMASSSAWLRGAPHLLYFFPWECFICVFRSLYMAWEYATRAISAVMIIYLDVIRERVTLPGLYSRAGFLQEDGSVAVYVCIFKAIS